MLFIVLFVYCNAVYGQKPPRRDDNLPNSCYISNTVSYPDLVTRYPSEINSALTISTDP
jgi:hypothetical protein